MGYRVADLIADYLASLPDGPAFRPVPADVAASFLADPLPRAGTSVDALLDDFATRVACYPFGNGHPRFAGWVNSPPTPIGIFAEALAAAMNPSVAGGNHAAVYVERAVLGWFRELVGFPAGAMGLLVSGGSMAALTALAVARHTRAGFDVRSEGLQGGHPRLTVYQSAETHACYRKAVELLGIGGNALRVVPVDGALRMDVQALAQVIRRDVQDGHRPVAVVASAGTVNTGAIDPLDAIADVCAETGVWMHVDGAYGAPAILSDAYRAALAPLARADSVALDPHKWLYVPVEAGLVLVRRGEAMRDTFSLVPPYLRTDGNAAGVGGPPWFSEFGFQQTRGFRALKVWMALRHHGVDGYRRAIEGDLALADYLAERVRSSARLELLEPRELSIVCFRCAFPGAGPEELDSLNQRVVEAVQLGGEAFLSSTVVDGRFWLRACFVNPLMRKDDVDALLAAVLDAAARTTPVAP